MHIDLKDQTATAAAQNNHVTRARGDKLDRIRSARVFGDPGVVKIDAVRLTVIDDVFEHCPETQRLKNLRLLLGLWLRREVLKPAELSIKSASREQFGVSAYINDAPGIKHNDAVSRANCREPMRNDDGRAVLGR